ncbi:MAG: alpha/beta fold hydrolase [Flavobacterium sp.]|nr:alpha/beta fold hydrolase [Candidatus Neoflavobacterium equi]
MLHTNLSLDYLIHEPSTIKEQNPLIVLMHGYGSNEEDLFSFAPELPQDSYIISVRAPHAMPPYGNAWYAINFDADQNKFTDDAQAAESRDLIAKFVNEAVSTYKIDPKNVTLIGFSQGAILSYAVALTFPEQIKNVIALSGYFHEAIMPSNITENPAVKALNFFASHGTQDQVIPVDWARRSKERLEGMGIAVTYCEYPVGHGVAPQNFYDFKNWLVSK